MKNKSFISKSQFLFIMIQTQIGIGILSLPYKVFHASKEAAWISVIVAGILIQVSSYILILLCRRFPHMTFFEFSSTITGVKLGKIITFIYALYFSMVGVLILKTYTKIIQTWLLPYTPIWFTSLIMVGSSLYLITNHLHKMARFTVLTFPFIAILFILITMSLQDAHFLNLLPLHPLDSSILTGTKEAFFSLYGFETILILYPFIRGGKKEKRNYILFANGVTILLYMYIVLLTILYFSPQELELLPESILYLVKSVSIPFITRLDLIFLSFWIIAILNSFAIYIYISTEGFSTLFRKTNQKKISFLVSTCIFFFSFMPNHLIPLHVWNYYLEWCFLLLVICIPSSLLIYSKWKNMKDVDD
ncbi:TPA: GerAB/ArcD/ProY family transporter [Bacillus cereus]|uniref:GerAB/ArcD/ProY family transporter n=1 Tax=Bacillus cereus TaxID=1396 RepID=UPI00065BE438|nr:hypothetical protein TU58_30505 [Bacillus cereus]